MLGDVVNRLFVRGGGSLKGCGVLKGINMLPSSDMGVTDPLLRVQRLRRAQRRSIKPFVLLRHALSSFSSRGELDFPLLPFGLSSPVFEMGYRPLTWECC